MIDEKELMKRMSAFCVADNKKAYLELAFTLGTLFTLFAAMIYSLDISYWLTFALLWPTGVMLTRTFTIQHDCGHYSFFSSLRVNNFVGSVLGALTLTPYYYWRKTHNFHHAFSGNLDKRGVGDVDTLTLNEYKELPLLKKIAYRIYKNPAVLMILGPAFVFGLKHRLPVDNPFHSFKAWANIMMTNLGIGLMVTALVYFFGWDAVLFVYLPVCWLASSIGVGLFFIHHQYEDMYWDKNENWSFFKAGLYGSSYFEFGRFPSWLIANINLHHIHHLNGRIPFYRLRECLEAIPEFRDVPKRTLKDIPKCFTFALWDEEHRKMISFSDMKAAG